ncbi:hypothetical protein ElyMa_005280200 [Elysia marginata]|uniref:Uncharacterized protein n=1 Tax=Elysia marginata TaxID=1093978 RepID=A0AAV4K1D1_9GAST|nr:hypothetical protein ElyMa_005280200 [Elysia marginata]
MHRYKLGEDFTCLETSQNESKVEISRILVCTREILYLAQVSRGHTSTPCAAFKDCITKQVQAALTSTGRLEESLGSSCSLGHVSVFLHVSLARASRVRQPPSGSASLRHVGRGLESGKMLLVDHPSPRSRIILLVRPGVSCHKTQVTQSNTGLQ